MTLKKKICAIVLLFLGSFLFLSPAYAYKTINAAQKTLGTTAEPTGLSTDDLQTSVGSIIQGALTIVGTVFFALMFYGGFLWMTARGEEDQITKGKNTIVAAVIGVSVVVSAYAITNIVQERIINTSGGSSGNLCLQRYSGCLNACNQSLPPQGVPDAEANVANQACRQACDQTILVNCNP